MLIRYVSISRPFLSSSFSIVPVIRSKPGAFLGFKFDSISVATSLGVACGMISQFVFTAHSSAGSGSAFS